MAAGAGGRPLRVPHACPTKCPPPVVAETEVHCACFFVPQAFEKTPFAIPGAPSWTPESAGRVERYSVRFDVGRGRPPIRSPGAYRPPSRCTDVYVHMTATRRPPRPAPTRARAPSLPTPPPRGLPRPPGPSEPLCVRSRLHASQLPSLRPLADSKEGAEVAVLLLCAHAYLALSKSQWPLGEP